MSDALPCRVRREQALNWTKQLLRQPERSGGEPPSQLVAWWALAETTNQRLGWARGSVKDNISEAGPAEDCIVVLQIKQP